MQQLVQERLPAVVKDVLEKDFDVTDLFEDYIAENNPVDEAYQNAEHNITEKIDEGILELQTVKDDAIAEISNAERDASDRLKEDYYRYEQEDEEEVQRLEKQQEAEKQDVQDTQAVRLNTSMPKKSPSTSGDELGFRRRKAPNSASRLSTLTGNLLPPPAAPMTNCTQARDSSTEPEPEIETSEAVAETTPRRIEEPMATFQPAAATPKVALTNFDSQNSNLSMEPDAESGASPYGAQAPSTGTTSSPELPQNRWTPFSPFLRLSSEPETKSGASHSDAQPLSTRATPSTELPLKRCPSTVPETEPGAPRDEEHPEYCYVSTEPDTELSNEYSGTSSHHQAQPFSTLRREVAVPQPLLETDYGEGRLSSTELDTQTRDLMRSES